MAHDNTLFLVDAFALIFRAHFAFAKSPRVTSTGLNTSAVFGFTTTLMEVLTKEKPSHLGVAFDTSAPTFRHQLFEQYKAQREETPEDIKIAVPYVKRMLKAMAIPILEVDGFEADDVIGTLALKAGEAGYQAYMMTPDKDYAQLVRPNVWLYRPASKFSPTEVLDREGVKAKFGVWPEQIADLLGMKGDAVDNIPGIPKIGDKTALELIEQFGSLEAVIKGSAEITKKSIRETVETNGEQGIFSKMLATIHTDVPIAFEPDKLHVGDWDRAALVEILRELEFKTLGNKLLEMDTALHARPTLSAMGGTLFGPAEVPAPTRSATVALEVIVPQQDYKTIADTPHTYRKADTRDLRQHLLNELLTVQEFSFDTETTGLNPHLDEVVGLSFSTAPGTGWYVPLPADAAQARAIIAEFAPALQHRGILKIAQNLKFDWEVLTHYGVEPQPPFYDTMLAHYAAQADAKHGMDDLARHYLNYNPVSIKELIGVKGKNQLTMRDVPLERVVEYAAEDADVTLQLKAATEADLERHNTRKVYQEVDLPLVPVLGRMEMNGIRIDPDFLNAYSVELEKDIQLTEQKVIEAAGMKFNVASPKQLAEVLFKHLGLDAGKKTKTGQQSTDEQTLSRLAAATGHPLPALVLEYRQMAKLKSTYVDALPTLVNPRTGLIHTNYNQTVAVTGRLSSQDPNLQNIPIRTDRGREVRKAFIPRSPEYTLLSADYSQIELRIMAALCQDPHLVEAFKSDEDVHRATASRVFNVPLGEVTSEMRRRAKMVNFGMIYGITPFGLSERLGIPRGEGKVIYDTFFRLFPSIKDYMDECVARARAKGYVETMMGRRQYLRDINSANATLRGFAERNSINSPIQGSAADMIKLAMVRLDANMRAANLRSKLLLQVHDELVLDAHLDELDILKPMVSEAMRNALPLPNVPVEVEMGTGPNWLEAH